MRRTRIAVAVVAACGAGLLLAGRQLGAQTPSGDAPPPSVFSLFREALEHAHYERYDEAIATARQIRQLYPDEPIGAFALLVPYQTIDRNYRVRTYDGVVDSLLDLSVELAQKALKDGHKSAHNYFCLGSAYGLRSINYASQHNWMGAFRDGSRLKSSFEQAIRANPEFYDSYFGLGMYNYWLGAKSKLLRALPFSGDRRKEGLAQLQLVCEKSRFLQVDARYALSGAYYNEGEYERALKILDELAQSFPDNPTLLYRLGRTLQALHRWQDAKNEFDKLYAVLRETPYQSHSYQVECLYHRALCAYQLGRYEEARLLAAQAKHLVPRCDFSREREGPLEKFDEIQKRLEKLQQKIESEKPGNLTRADSK